MFSWELLGDALVLGVLVGCFYAAVSIGLSISFGLLDVPNVAHPALLVLASYGAWLLGDFDIDPIVAGLLLMPPFFVLGVMLYRTYHETFEKRGSDAGVRGLAFFFAIVLSTQHAQDVDQRTVQAFYIGKSVEIFEIRIPMRMVVAFAMALLLSLALTFYLSKTFLGRAIRAVAQDEGALRLMGADPVAIKQWAFGIATAVVALAGALLIIVQPVEPTLDRAYIGRTFCVVVMAGLGSMSGTLLAGIILGVAETIVLTMFGASWAPAISFTLLLIVLGVRPQGLFGR